MDFFIRFFSDLNHPGFIGCAKLVNHDYTTGKIIFYSPANRMNE
jgi:hypothetical protein